MATRVGPVPAPADGEADGAGRQTLGRQAPGRGEDARLLSDYRRLVSRHRTALAACLAVGLVLALGYLYLTRGSYTSSVQLDVRDPASKVTPLGDKLPLELTMDAEVRLLGSAAVTGTAGTALGIPPDEVARRTSVTVPANTRQLKIAYTAGTRAGARAGAQAVAQAYLTTRELQYRRSRDAEAAALSATKKSVDEALAEERRKSTDTTLPKPRRRDAERQVETLTGSSDRLDRRVKAMQALDTVAADPIGSATPARGPKLVNRLVPIATGLALGFLAWVLLLDRLALRRPVIRPSDARVLPGVRTVRAVGPVLRAPDAGTRGRSERVLLGLWADVIGADPTTPRVVAVLPADSRLVSREVAIDLAATSAGRQVRTALAIIGNPPWPLLQALGLEDALQEGGSYPQGVQEVGESPRVPGLTLVALRQPVGLPIREGLREGLARIGRTYDHVVVLAPPPGTVEHQAIAWAASVPMLVAERRQTRLSTVADVVGALRAAGSDPLWVLVAGGQARGPAGSKASAGSAAARPTEGSADAEPVGGTESRPAADGSPGADGAPGAEIAGKDSPA